MTTLIHSPTLLKPAKPGQDKSLPQFVKVG